MDSFAKKCFKEEKHLYWNRNKNPISLLTMLDDVLSISNCGPEATRMIEFLNIQSSSKRLQFATDKTYRLHVGRKRPEYKCENAYIDSLETGKSSKINDTETFAGPVRIKETRSTKYLGEVISSDGTNTENVAARKRRGCGTVKEIVNMLDKMCLGPYLPS